MPQAETEMYRKVPGLFRVWDLQFVFNREDDFQIHYAEQTSAGAPLFAVYRKPAPAIPEDVT